MHNNQKLAPCPCCGERERIETVLHPGTMYAACEGCGFRGPELLPRHERSNQELLHAVIAAWNGAAACDQSDPQFGPQAS
jgi:hypothetical protein